MSTNTTAEIFAKVAPYLGDGWSAEPVDEDNRTGGYLVHEDGPRLHAYGPYNKDRLSISGVFPSGYQGRPEHQSITVAKDRDPKAIAADITRRLLPGYLAELERVIDEMEAAQVTAAKQAEAIEKLRDIFGLATATERGLRWFDNGDGVSYGDVTLYADGSKGGIEIHSVSFDTLARLFAVLAEVREEELAERDAEVERSAFTED